MTTFYALALVVILLGIFGTVVALAAIEQDRLLDARIDSFENLMFDALNNANLKRHDIETHVKRLTHELCYVRDSLNAKITEQTRPLQPEGAEGCEPAESVPHVPARVLPFVGRGVTLAAAVHTAEAAGLREVGPQRSGEVPTQSFPDNG